MSVAPSYAACLPGVWTQVWTGSTLLLGGRIPLWVQLAPGTAPGIFTLAWRIYLSAPPFYFAGSVSGRPRSGPRPPDRTLPPNAVLAPIVPATAGDLWMNCPVSLDIAA